MKINCELPNCLLELNNDLNEYDFVLFHLYKSDPIYKKYYKEQRLKYPERLMIFDNSAYEFYIKGEVLNLQEYTIAIDELKPDYYILPDKLMDFTTTFDYVDDFLGNYKIFNKKSQPMGVIQGKNEAELMKSIYKYTLRGIDAIAIPFHLKFYTEFGQNNIEIVQNFKEMFGVLNDDHKYSIGRINFIEKHKEILKNFEHIHILGSHYPLEKIYYNDFQTMDTGYPVKCGVVGYKLFEEPSKPDIIIDDFMNEEFSTHINNLITNNVEAFKLL